MTRNVQSQTGRSETGKTFLRLLGNAIIWLVLATILPLRAIIGGAFPELAPYAHWVPTLFYLLALWSFVRAMRTLQRLTAGRARTLFQPKAPGGAQKQGPANAKPVKTKTGLPVPRTPTVQRMR